LEIDIDARGLECPRPVVKVKEALERGSRSFTILVDNETARDNVSRFARSSGCTVEVNAHEEGFAITVTPGPGAESGAAKSAGCATEAGTVLFISNDEIGGGERELGANLMKMFLYTYAEREEPPSMVVLMNTGVRLATENEETASHIKRLEEKGSEVLVCGTCLDYYGLKENLKVGRVSNMYEIQSALVGAGRLVSL
jgi:selenium metabolism protein YedF